MGSRGATACALMVALGASDIAAATPQDETTTVEARATLPDGVAALLLMRLEVRDGDAVVFSARADADATGVVRWDTVPAAP